VTASIVPTSAIGGPARLEALAVRVFGSGDRPCGWFERKLRRERVDAELSMVAARDTAELTDPAAWLGYVLVGRPACLPGVARTAGTGVVSEAHGRGIGADLVRAVRARAGAAGLHTVRTLASAAARPFYERMGFSCVREVTTLLAFGRGRAAEFVHGPEPWTPADVVPGQTHVEACAWLEDAWVGTEAHLRHTLSIDAGGELPGWVHLSREGLALLAHRVLVPWCGPEEDALRAFARGLLEHVPEGRPVMIFGLDPRASATAALLADGWSAVQHGAVMACRT
jgi:GNAT superfamily N-acetyltransferase